MVVLQLVKSLGRGGAEMLLQETLKHHDQAIFEFHYIYFLPWKDQMVQGIREAGGKVTNFPARNNVALILQVPKLIRYCKTNKVELIHCHLPWAGFAGRIIHRITGIPVIYTEHNKQERYHRITRFLNKVSFSWQSRVVAVSADVAESIQKNIPARVPVQTILNGVNTDHFQRDAVARLALRQRYGIPEDAVVIGTIAVFRFQKRLKEWVDVVKQIQAQHPNTYAFMVGDGILNEEIRAYVKSEGMESAIIMPGLQTEVLPWFSAFDIYMMTSEFEGLPIALLEAMSMQCAIVSTNAGGIPELVRHGTDGQLVAVDAYLQLVPMVNQLIREPEQIAQWGAKARERVVTSFSVQEMVQQLESLYKTYLSKHS